MSATALQNPALRLQPTTVPPGPRRPSHPELRLLEGGRAPARVAQQAVYRRRRLVAGVLVAIAVVALVLLATAAAARIAGGAPSAAGGPSPTSAAAPGAAGVAAPTVVVQPGDTLWSIAAEVAPGTDVRVTVDRLVALNGSSPIVAGQELVVPS
jgi:LysM domain